MRKKITQENPLRFLLRFLLRLFYKFSQAMPLRQQDVLSGKDTKLLRVEPNKQNKEKAHLHHSSPSNDTDVLILLIIFMRD